MHILSDVRQMEPEQRQTRTSARAAALLDCCLSPRDAAANRAARRYCRERAREEVDDQPGASREHMRQDRQEALMPAPGSAWRHGRSGETPQPKRHVTRGVTSTSPDQPNCMQLAPILSAKALLNQLGIVRRDSFDLLPLRWYYHPLFCARRLGFDTELSDGVQAMNDAFAGKVNRIHGTNLYREKHGKWAQASGHTGKPFFIYVFTDDNVGMLSPPRELALKAQKATVKTLLLPTNAEMLAALLEGDILGAMKHGAARGGRASAAPCADNKWYVLFSSSRPVSR